MARLFRSGLMVLMLSISLHVLVPFTASSQGRVADTSSVWHLSLENSVVSAYQRPSLMNVTDQIPERELKRYVLVSDAIRNMTGVQIKDFGGIGGMKTINIRSLGSEHTGVFIDGLQVDNAQNMQVDLGRFSTENLAYIDLYSAGKVTAVQSAREYASGNSVYLTSKRPELSSGNPTNSSVRMRLGSFGTFAPSATVEHRLSRGSSVRLSTELIGYEGSYRFRRRKFQQMPDGSYAGYDTLMRRYNNDLKSLRFDAQMFSPDGSTSVWDMKAYLYDSERGLPGPVIRRLSQTTADRQSDLNAFLQGRWKSDFRTDDRLTLLLSGKLSYDYLRYRTDPVADPFSMPFDNTYRLSEAYGSSSLRYHPVKSLSFNVAEDFQYSYMDSNMNGFVYPSRYSLWSAFALSWVSDRVRADASIVYMFSLDTFGNGSIEHAGAYARENSKRDSYTPSLNLAWTVSKNLAVAGFVKRSYRMPSFNDLYYTLIGNSSLKPETAWQSDVNLRWTRSFGEGWDFVLRAEAYYNHVTDKIVATPTSSQFRWSMYNIGNVHILGSEVKMTLDRRFDSGLAAGAMVKYSLQDARDYSDSRSSIYGNQIAYVARHSGAATLDMSYRGWDASWNMTFSGKRYSTGSNIEDYLILPWTTSDVVITRTIDVASRGILEVNLSLNNILNEQYEFVQGYPMPGFNLMAGLKYTFGRR